MPYRVFSDPEIYQAELGRVFLGATWQFLALAGELPNPGDYKTTFLGETPVVVTRGEDGQIHAMVNRCAHRGNLVCLKRQGNADALTCVYHSWSYDLEGNLKSVAFRRGIACKGGMPDDFRLEDHGLRKLRVDHFAGLVFGTLSEETPPLADYIGNLIGERLGRVLHGKPKILGTTSQILHNNWKLYLENTRDTYHASLLHTFFTTFRVARLTNGGGVLINESGTCHASYTRGGVETVGKDGADKLYAGIQSQRDGLHLEDTRLLESVAEFGDDITVQILSVFPNFVLQQVNNSIAMRLVLPKGPDQTELQWVFLGFEEDDAALNELRLLQSNLVGPAGYVSMEDGAVGGFVQRAIVGSEHENSLVEMGGHGHTSEETRTTEASIRGFLAGRIAAADGLLTGMSPAEIGRRLEIETLYTDYAHCLDDDALEAWPDFFVEDCYYRITSAENFEAGLPLGLVYLTSAAPALVDRIMALRKANIYEPQRYRHLVGAIKIGAESGGALAVTANVAVIRTMQDGAMSVFAAGRYVDRLAPTPRARTGNSSARKSF